MSHTIIIVQNGAGSGGSASSRVEYTPNHAVPPIIQIRKADRAAQILEALNDYLYGNVPFKVPDDV